jgi:S-adenosylmethionine hydrolase
MFVAQKFGIKEIREIDEAVNRRANTELSYTFHGRDVYVYTAARLAGRIINFEQIGKKLPAKVEQLSYTQPAMRNKQANGCIWCLDIQFGNV